MAKKEDKDIKDFVDKVDRLWTQKKADEQRIDTLSLIVLADNRGAQFFASNNFTLPREAFFTLGGSCSPQPAIDITTTPTAKTNIFRTVLFIIIILSNI